MQTLAAGDGATATQPPRALVPEVTIPRAHGRMSAAEIDDAMVRFADGDGRLQPRDADAARIAMVTTLLPAERADA